MSGLGLLATAFGSYASTLGGLYKEQVDKEQAAQEKLAAEEREFKRQLALKDIDHEWEREKTAEARAFAIDMLQREFDLDVKRMDMENAWEAKRADIEHQRDLEKAVYEYELWKKQQEFASRLDRRDFLARQAIAQGSGTGTKFDPKEVDALVKQLTAISKMIENARRPEEKQAWVNKFNAIQRVLNKRLGIGNVGVTDFTDPNDIINSLANE